MTTPQAPLHGITRVRREPKRRRMAVVRAWALTPAMRRIEFTSADFADFDSAAPDDHVKLFVPDASLPQGVAGRDYTPRAFDVERRSLTIDFALHDAGPATAWAITAKPGDVVEIGGPRGSVVVADDFDFYWLVGDETALPAIGRRLESLRSGVAVMTAIVVDDPGERQSFSTQADWRPHWAYRSRGGDDADLLKSILVEWTPPAGDGYVWLATEAAAARALRTYLLDERGLPKAWFKGAGYWVRGKAGESEKFES